MTNPIVLILGAGQRLGQETAATFSERGWRVVCASRSRKDQLRDNKHLDLQVDLVELDSTTSVFTKINRFLGEPPTVVVYNGFARSLHDASDPLSSITNSDLEGELNINTNSAVIAVQHAVRGWKTMPPSPYKTFIYTGNKLPVMARPFAPIFGMSKSAAAHLIWDLSVAYKDKGWKFYFIDERFADGSPTQTQMDPRARGRLHGTLAENPEQAPFYYTYVKETGYVDFRDLYGGPRQSKQQAVPDEKI